MKDYQHLVDYWDDRASQYKHLHLEVPCVCGVCIKWGSGQLRCCHCGDVRSLRARGRKTEEMEGIMDAFIERHKGCQAPSDGKA
jgi:hypothetical protein